MEKINKYPCPVCGYLVFEEGPGSQEICSICYWQDDVISLRYPNKAIGPNKVSLTKAQENFVEFKASEERFISNVRAVTTEDIKDINWHVFNKDTNKEFQGDIFPTNDEALYYWRNENKL